MSSSETNTLALLPTEVLVNIFSFLSDKEIKTLLTQVSRQFYDIVSEYHLKTLYAKTLRFAQWQDKQFAQCNKTLDTLHARYQVTMFHNPYHAGLRGFIEGQFNYLYVGCLVISAIFSIANDILSYPARPKKVEKSEREKALKTSETQTTSFYFIVISVVLTLLEGATRLFKLYRRHAGYNAEYQNTQIDDVIRNDINQFKNKFAYLLNNQPLAIDGLPANTTVSQLRQALLDTKTQITTVIKQQGDGFVEHLKTYRFTSARQACLTTIPVAYQDYAVEVNEEWLKGCPDESLFFPS